MRSKGSHLFKWLQSLLFASVILFFGRAYIVEPVVIDGISMEPTIHDRERMLVTKTVGWSGNVDRGDIVIITTDDPNLNYVKRIVGKPQDTIEVINDQLFINQELVKEPYLKENEVIAHNKQKKLMLDFGPITIPDNHYFVMGDNRSVSVDSRSDLGFIEKERIIGKGELIFYPFTNVRIIQ
ncbi:signal peptidase I [Pseudogracilibacillus auburnensis]|uniref:signal peptidase I n=1 Tax=Pseudogracilibacillus auburnensis TaxID=1494959 RepID=UPI001A95A0F2|nr:signal peptidase I [Pseudogracilibacillus auburnensis]MBO1005095.1 signal peptidase I [Pseudogracilibacillus auburnensis]